VTIISQTQAGLRPPPLTVPNQFQRADVNDDTVNGVAVPCGNGRIDAGDVTLIAQWAVGIGTPRPACGDLVPRSQPSRAEEESSRPFAVGRTIRAVNTTATAGGTVTVSFVIDSQGDEASASYTISFPQATLSNPVVAIGSGVPSGTSILTNTSQVAQGRIGVLIATPNAYAAGTRQMITVTFNVAAGAAAGTYPIGFTNTPVQQSVSSAAGGAILTTAYEPGNVVIGPTAAGVEVSGRVVTPDGRGLRNATVTITDAKGNAKTVTTGSFGNYRFTDVGSGESYVIAVSSKRYRFTSRVINVSDTLTDVDFVGSE
jgi:hypothetical protein